MYSIPRHLIHKHGTQKATQLRVLAYVRHLAATHGGYWFDTDEDIARNLKVARITVRRSFDWLTDQGYLWHVGDWKNTRTKRKRYRLSSLKRHEDRQIDTRNKVVFDEDQIKSNDKFLLAFVAIDVYRNLKAQRKRDTAVTNKAKEANACRRRPEKGTPTQVSLPYAYFCNRYRMSTRRFKRVQRLGNELEMFYSKSDKILMEGISPLSLPFIDRDTGDGYLFVAKDGKVYERKVTVYSKNRIVSIPMDISTITTG